MALLREGSVVLLWGGLGAGKSAFAVKLVRQQVREGRPDLSHRERRWSGAVATSPLARDMDEVRTWDEVLDAHNRLVLVDEGHLWFPGQAVAGRGARLCDEAVDLLTFCRKRGQALVICAQHEMRLSPMVRHLLTHDIRCRRIALGLHCADWREPLCGPKVVWRTRYRPSRVGYDTRAFDVGPGA